MAQPFSEFITIGDIADVKGGKRLPKGMVVQDQETSHPYLRVVDFNNDSLDRSNVRYINDDAFARVKRYTITNEDVYISIAGTIGRVGVIPKDLSGANLTENAAKITNINSDINKIFLMYYLRSHLGQSDIASKVVGTSQPKLALFRIQGLKVPKVPLPTQRKIAAILSAYDDLIENNLRRIKILEEMEQNLYREWFVKFRFPGHQNARFTDSPLGRIPEGWEVKRILEFGNVITGKTPSKANPDFYGEDVPFVKTPDMHGNTFILDVGERLSVAGAQSQANKTIPAGSICVSCIGTIGVVSITTEDCQTNQQINSVVLMKEQFREFLFLRLKDAKQALENLGANGATMGNVNKGKFESIEVITPSDDLVYRYHECTAPLFSEMFVLSRKNTTLRRTRDLLLPRLISGEVDVSELDITVPEEVAA